MQIPHRLFRSHGRRFKTLVQAGDFRKTVLRQELPKLCCALVVGLTGSFINCVAMAIVERDFTKRGIGSQGPEILYDWMFHHLPDASERFATLPDTFVAVGALSFLLRFIFPGRPMARWRLVKRMSLLTGIVYLCRGCMIFITRLPNPHAYCIATDSNMFTGLLDFAWNIFKLRSRTCRDVMFSGHTAILTLMLHSLQDSFAESYTPFLISVFACSHMSIFVILTWTRFHYSIDILTAWLLASLFFYLYEATTRRPKKHFLLWLDR